MSGKPIPQSLLCWKEKSIVLQMSTLRRTSCFWRILPKPLGKCKANKLRPSMCVGFNIMSQIWQCCSTVCMCMCIINVCVTWTPRNTVQVHSALGNLLCTLDEHRHGCCFNPNQRGDVQSKKLQASICCVCAYVFCVDVYCVCMCLVQYVVPYVTVLFHCVCVCVWYGPQWSSLSTGESALHC